MNTEILFVTYQIAVKLKEKGFTDFSITYNKDALTGMRWICNINDATSLTLDEEIKEWGSTPTEAVKNAVASVFEKKTKSN